jgi:hypothetical protein
MSEQEPAIVLRARMIADLEMVVARMLEIINDPGADADTVANAKEALELNRAQMRKLRGE